MSVALPWQAERDAAGRVTVFGLCLGANTLADLRALLGASGEGSDSENPGSES